jgi:predicted acetyltransferase
MKIDIVAAIAEDFAVVSNLFELYAYDLSEFMGFDVGHKGRYGLPQSLWNYWGGAAGTGELKWPADWRGFPFLVRADDKLAGFALIRQLSEAHLDMGEFFILRKHRRTGLGAHVARDMFDRFPGTWEVRELPPNLPAQSFWRKIISDYTDGKFEEGRKFFDAYRGEFVFQRFKSRTAK